MSTQTRPTGAAPNRPPPPRTRPRRKLSRRIDHVLLRWQARLDAEWADRVVPWVGAGLLFAMLFTLAMARASTLQPGEVLGSFSQAAWLISTGNDAEPTITGDHLLAAHTPLAFWPIAWLTRVLPTIPTLLGVQSAALALGVVPLWRLARRVVHLRVGAAATLGVSYGLHPAVQNLNLADFHPQALAVAPLLAATLLRPREALAPVLDLRRRHRAVRGRTRAGGRRARPPAPAGRQPAQRHAGHRLRCRLDAGGRRRRATRVRRRGPGRAGGVRRLRQQRTRRDRGHAHPSRSRCSATSSPSRASGC